MKTSAGSEKDATGVAKWLGRPIDRNNIMKVTGEIQFAPWAPTQKGNPGSMQPNNNLADSEKEAMGQTRTVGDAVRVNLSDGFHVYARVLPDATVAFYDSRTDLEPPLN